MMDYSDLCSRCWLEVDISAIEHNLAAVKKEIKPQTELIAVVKANAYGLGLCEISHILWNNGVKCFAVACLDEAFALHENIPEARVLCMGESVCGDIKKAIKSGVRLTAGSQEAIDFISESAGELRQTAYIHCKVDTGLHRIGLDPSIAAEKIRKCCENPFMQVEGIYTHLALHSRQSDERQHSFFISVIENLKKSGHVPAMIHMLDSIGLIRYPQWQYNAVRIGALLYGNPPKDYTGANNILSPVRFVARVIRIADVKKGEYIGYDDENRLLRDSKIATLSVGYADGYPRCFSNCGVTEIRGKRTKNIGLICMDQMMTDVTEIEDVCIGDEAVLLGDGISLTEYASAGHLNRNECTAIIGQRVPRVYVRKKDDGTVAIMR